MPKKVNDIVHDAMEPSHQERAILAERMLATLDPGEEAAVEETRIQ
jgi:hypothetical protein